MLMNWFLINKKNNLSKLRLLGRLCSFPSLPSCSLFRSHFSVIRASAWSLLKLSHRFAYFRGLPWSPCLSSSFSSFQTWPFLNCAHHHFKFCLVFVTAVSR